MNTPSPSPSSAVPNASPQASTGQHVIAPVNASPVQPLYWCVRRELWEYRALYLGPLLVAGVFLLGFVFSVVHQRIKIAAFLVLTRQQQLDKLQQPYNSAAAMIMAAAFLVQLFYCVEALHSERRDRSILFWKSLPVSDLNVVLSKAAIPLVVLPVIAFVTLITTELFMLLLHSAALLGSGVNAAWLWTRLSLPQGALLLLYHLLTVHMLWYAPIYGWLLLISGWARRMPFLWAVLPPLALCILEKIAFNSSHLATMLLRRFSGPQSFPMTTDAGAAMDWMQHLDLVQFLSTPGLWIGLSLAAAFLATAAHLRRYRGPI